MAQRFYFSDSNSPAVNLSKFSTSWLHITRGDPPVPQARVRALNDTLGASTLANTATSYDPGISDHIVDGDALNTSFVSRQLDAQTIGVQTVKIQIQASEVHAGNNLFISIKVFLISATGDIVPGGTILDLSRATDLELVTGTLTNRGLSANTTSVDCSRGDCICVDVGQGGLPVAIGGVQGHDATLRFGESGASGDLPEDGSNTATDRNPWIEFSTGGITFLSNDVPAAHRALITATTA